MKFFSSWLCRTNKRDTPIARNISIFDNNSNKKSEKNPPLNNPLSQRSLWFYRFIAATGISANIIHFKLNGKRCPNTDERRIHTYLMNETVNRHLHLFLGHRECKGNQKTECSSSLIHHRNTSDGFSAAVNLSLWFHCSGSIRLLLAVFRLVHWFEHTFIHFALNLTRCNNQLMEHHLYECCHTDFGYTTKADEDKQNAAVHNFPCITYNTPIAW